MIKKREDGTTYYYYYKKKVGRPKKRGRKKQPKKRGRSWQKPWDFKIVRCTFNKQDEFVGRFHDLGEVEQARKILEEENNKVVLPVKFVNSSRLDSVDRYNKTEFVCEYLILKKIRKEEDKEVVKLRNEYGRLIEHTTNSDKWNIYDKFPCIKEETFWVYGFNPLNGRKDCIWIYNNMIIAEFMQDNMMVIQVYAYKNKVIFRYDATRVRFVICKNNQDAIRLYNKLDEFVADNKVRRCYFIGQLSSYSEIGKKIINQLVDLTGWDIKKVRQKYT